MNFIISKNTLYQTLFTICVALPYNNNYELTFAVWLIVLLATITQKYSILILKTVAPFLVIIGIAAISAIFSDNSIYNIIRDITYILKPLIGIIVGYQLCKNCGPKVMNTIINAGLFIAIIHLGIIFSAAIIHKIININVLRGYGGFFSDYEVYVLIILLFHKQFQLEYSKPKLYLFIFIIGFSSFLYVSRTNFVQMILFYLTLKGFFRLTTKSILVFISLTIFTLISYSAIYNMNLSRSGKGLEALLYKIKNAPIEALKTKINQDDYEDFNDNFRSFENIKTVKQVTTEGGMAIVFGKGLGATVDIGRRMLTNDNTFVRYEAILHNAYMTVFLKSGLLGVVCLIYSMYVLMFHKKSENQMINQLNLLLFATGIFLIFENWVLLGIFLKTESKAVLIGFIICYKEILNKRLLANEKQ